jgi:hypothetical protein
MKMEAKKNGNGKKPKTQMDLNREKVVAMKARAVKIHNGMLPSALSRVVAEQLERVKKEAGIDINLSWFLVEKSLESFKPTSSQVEAAKKELSAK